jgi:uncharacterized protein (TIGR03067 family)
MKAKWLLAVAVGLLVAADNPKKEKDDSKSELKKLAGTWSAVSEVANGDAKDKDEIKKQKLIITADGKWDLQMDGKTVYKGSMKIDPTKKPKSIDFVVGGGTADGTVAKGIYEFKGDDLKTCWTLGDERPKKFESTGDNACTYTIYKRAKKDKK